MTALRGLLPGASTSYSGKIESVVLYERQFRLILPTKKTSYSGKSISTATPSAPKYIGMIADVGLLMKR